MMVIDCKIGKKTPHMEPPMVVQSWRVGSGKIGFGSNSSILDVTSLDPQRGLGKNLEALLQDSVARKLGSIGYSMGQMGAYCVAKGLRGVGAQKCILFCKILGSQGILAYYQNF